jgi:hypothetical protein
MTALSGWQNFYVIVGSSAGALIGLQFVVITLIADIPIGDGAEQAGHAFATPTIVHFGAVLLLASVLSAPWHGIAPAAVLWGLMPNRMPPPFTFVAPELSQEQFKAICTLQNNRKTSSSEVDLQSQLQLTRIVDHPSDQAKCARTYRSVWPLEMWMVKRVK